MNSAATKVTAQDCLLTTGPRKLTRLRYNAMSIERYVFATRKEQRHWLPVRDNDR